MKMSMLAVAATVLAALAGPALADDDGPSIPFGASVLIIELTEDDIELQVFVDGTDWTRVKISDPNERRIFDARAKGRLNRQNGMSEMFWASEPTHTRWHKRSADPLRAPTRSQTTCVRSNVPAKRQLR